MHPGSVSRLLTRHFLRRFFENDLISPHVDLHENMFTACAAIVSISLFVSVMIGGQYMFGSPPPGVVAVNVLGNNFMFLNAAMFAMALVAALQWDALSLDVRDVANLGSLPIPRRALVQSKLSALAIFGAGFAIALSAFPSLFFQLLTVVQTPVGLSGLVRLAGGHAVASLLASMFGFLSVVAVREGLRAVLRDAWFARASALVQGVFVLLFTSGLLLTPALAVRVTGAWMREGYPSPWVMPTLAFLGLEQTLNGGAIANVTGVSASRRMTATNERALAAYRSVEPYFREWQVVALALAAISLVVAALAYAWNVRQPPQPLHSSGRRRWIVPIVSRLAGGDSMRRAGFSFALHAIVRSAPHRLSMAGAAALAMTFAFMFLSGIGFRPAQNPWYPPVLILAVQTLAITIMLGGFRRAVRVPAELRANWVMQVTWQRGERRFLGGIKRAAIVGVALPTLAVLALLHVWLLSPAVAALHAVIGLCYSLAVNEGLFVGCKKVPLAASYEPMGHVKTVGPIIFILFLIFVNSFTRVERVALQSTQGVVNLALALLVAMLLFRTLDYWLTRDKPPLKFDEPPEPLTQWLRLTE